MHRRWLVAVLLVLAGLAGLTGCTVSRPSSQPLTGGSPGRSPRPTSSATARPVWLETIPEAVLTGANGEPHAGVLLSSRWFTAVGTVQVTTPGDAPVAWPAAVAASAAADL